MFSSEIRVAFVVDETTEVEDVGVVMLCAEVVDGSLAREVIVTVASSDGSAIGTSKMMST